MFTVQIYIMIYLHQSKTVHICIRYYMITTAIKNRTYMYQILYDYYSNQKPYIYVSDISQIIIT